MGLPPASRSLSALLLLLSLCTTSTATALAAPRSKASRKSPDLINSPLLTSKIPTNRTIIVDQSGGGDFTKVQAAIDSVPHGNSEWVIVHLRSGVYREKVVVPEGKDYIFLRGNGKGRTAIVWDDVELGNIDMATFSVGADHFVAFGISFKNDAAIGMKGSAFNRSVAAAVAGDKVAFYHCAFYSPHNTLFDYKGRHYYESCYIQGNVDFIFGRAQSIFQSCEIFVLADTRRRIYGSITAQNRQSEEDDSGFVFLKGSVYGVKQAYLGRAKGSHSRVIFSKVYLSKTISPDGWTRWSYNGTTDNLFHGEHDCYGPGSDHTNRAAWTQQLDEKDAAPFTSIDFINGKEWLPAYF